MNKKGEFGEPWKTVRTNCPASRNIDALLMSDYEHTVGWNQLSQEREDRAALCVTVLDGLNPDALPEVLEAMEYQIARMSGAESYKLRTALVKLKGGGKCLQQK